VLRDVLILALAAVVKPVAAQALPADESGAFRLSATAELVLLDVSVKAGNGEHVSGLTRDNFRVYENGKLQTISRFAS
jgi:hypothetical protein